MIYSGKQLYKNEQMFFYPKNRLVQSFSVRFSPKTIRGLEGQGFEPSTSDLSQDCEICRFPPVLPTRAGCGHSFCYFCIKSSLGNFGDFRCPICNQTLSEAKLFRVVLKWFISPFRHSYFFTAAWSKPKLLKRQNFKKFLVHNH